MNGLKNQKIELTYVLMTNMMRQKINKKQKYCNEL